MKTFKWMTILLWTIALAFSMTANVAAAPQQPNTKEKTLEQRINGLTLTPQPKSENAPGPDWYDFARVEKISGDSSLSNYEKMKAVYLDIAEQTKGFSCTSHTSLLGTAYEMLGFKVYGTSGGVRTKDGKTPAMYEGKMGFVKEGYTHHSWITVEIDGACKIVPVKETGSVNGNPFDYEVNKIEGQDISVGDDIQPKGELLYFDVNLYSTYGMRFESCFAVQPQNTGELYTAVGIGSYF